MVLLFASFVAPSGLGVYEGVDQTGRPLGPVARYLRAFYFGGLFVFGAIGGEAVQAVQRR